MLHRMWTGRQLARWHRTWLKTISINRSSVRYYLISSSNSATHSPCTNMVLRHQLRASEDQVQLV